MAELIKIKVPLEKGSFSYHLTDTQKVYKDDYNNTHPIEAVEFRTSKITYNAHVVGVLMEKTGLSLPILIRSLLKLPQEKSDSIDPRLSEEVVKAVNVKGHVLVIKDSTKAGKPNNQDSRYTGKSQINIGALLTSEISRIGMDKFLRVVDIYAAVTKNDEDYQVMEKINGVSFDQLAENIDSQGEAKEFTKYISILRDCSFKLTELLQSTSREKSIKIENLRKENQKPIRFLQARFGINKDFFVESKYDLNNLQNEVSKIQSFQLALEPFTKISSNISSMNIRNLSFIVQEYLNLESIAHPNAIAEISKGATLNSQSIKGDNLMVDLDRECLVIIDPTLK